MSLQDDGIEYYTHLPLNLNYNKAKELRYWHMFIVKAVPETLHLCGELNGVPVVSSPIKHACMPDKSFISSSGSLYRLVGDERTTIKTMHIKNQWLLINNLDSSLVEDIVL